MQKSIPFLGKLYFIFPISDVTISGYKRSLQLLKIISAFLYEISSLHIKVILPCLLNTLETYFSFSLSFSKLMVCGKILIGKSGNNSIILQYLSIKLYRSVI